ncbi:hypothetical protein H310_13891 [Aphanomyces invadans]|uniref:Uncharacterized protein n=1 Tax=Aphanomyces invadans TaxID=157072 RepID=A0A024TBV5_9STRA|nr:hypothetical protein H310_13891 [Aphanomyces invadans]ETV91645.1 hypothetical protein H310_13891 [Aphanomyces invadans]|eukprot:XP_008879764.1 hypothetical protein H310_13891 [Aphanomyces invadans]
MRLLTFATHDDVVLNNLRAVDEFATFEVIVNCQIVRNPVVWVVLALDIWRGMAIATERVSHFGVLWFRDLHGTALSV